MKKSPEIEYSDAVSVHEIEIAYSRDYYVVQHNDLIQKNRFKLEKNAGQSLSTMEQKVLFYLISQIKPDAAALEPMILDIQTFCEIAGFTSKDSYSFVKSAITKLKSRCLWLYDTETGEETTVDYIHRATLNKRSGKIKIVFDELMQPYLLNLAGNYTQFSLHNILCMKSKYGIMLYQLLKSYYYLGPRIRFSIEDLKGHLDAIKYDAFKDFRKKVIEAALADINKFSDLEVSAEYTKTGRSFSHVTFNVRCLEKPKTLEDAEKARQRYNNVERKLNPDQLVLDEILGSDF